MKVKYGVVVGKFVAAPVTAKGAISCVAAVWVRGALYC
jgi:hypothetical protein